MSSKARTKQITMSELAKIVKKKYDDFDITPRQLKNVIRDNNINRKRTRHEHFPVMRYGTPIEKHNQSVYKIRNKRITIYAQRFDN